MKLLTHISGNNRFLTGYTNVGSSLLRGKYILSVKRGGTGLSKIKTSGVPVDKQAVYFSLTGNILVAGNPNPGEVTTILYKNLGAES